ncbi:ganglioside GM2 activator-like [Gigantopelta aegis]|uniref:ganglioside GM2 activator-like n=1 Tax=Gigantopelta aegis TaxID=1735272 RepID=UPI001B88C817|nr:ganglioside GM2 activator-like [Gigantopelta aegis]
MSTFFNRACYNKYSRNDIEEWGLMLRKLTLKPDPVEIPGNITAWGYIRVNKPIVGNISLELKLKRYLGFFWLSVPCLKNIGSCTYPDVCELLEDHYNETIGCNENLQAHDIPCTCPFLPGTYTLKPEMFQIPQLKGLWASLAKGDYKADVRLRDTDSNEVIACQHIEFSLTNGFVPTVSPTDKPKCTNILDCLFG